MALNSKICVVSLILFFLAGSNASFEEFGAAPSPQACPVKS